MQIFSTPKTTLFLLSVVLLLLWGCSSQDPNNYSPNSPMIVDDDANILSPQIKKEIEDTIKFPKEIVVLVKTVDKLDVEKIGSYASDSMQEETYWEHVRPKGFFSKWIMQDKPWSMGVYVLVSKQPNLLQIRYGERIRLEAYRSGLAIGDKYLQIQQEFKKQGVDRGTFNALKELSHELPSALSLPWYLHYTKPLIAVAFSELEELVLPSDGLYSSWLLKPYLKLISGLGGFYSIWYFLLLNLILFLVFELFFASILVNAILRNRKPQARRPWKNLASTIIGALIALPFFSSIILLSSGRFEDFLALQQLGITSADRISLDLSWFIDITGFWMALLITLINYINLWIMDPLRNPSVFYYYGPIPHAHSGQPSYPTIYSKWRLQQINDHTYAYVYDEYFYGPRISLLIFLLFMPKAISLVVLLKMLFDLPVNIMTSNRRTAGE